VGRVKQVHIFTYVHSCISPTIHRPFIGRHVMHSSGPVVREGHLSDDELLYNNKLK